MFRSRLKLIGGILLFLLLTGADGEGSGCSNQSRAEQQATDLAEDRDTYVMQNDVEGSNYNKRQKRADDPTAIIWCTSAFPVPSSPMFTVPVVGKLTSGSKRPFDINPNQAGPDGMYGSSGEYRYGFTPGDAYVDFYGMATFCTDEPMIWQRQNTKIVMQTDPELKAAHERARSILKSGVKKDSSINEEALRKAYRELEQAIQKQ